jgi:hypothetical protein
VRVSAHNPQLASWHSRAQVRSIDFLEQDVRHRLKHREHFPSWHQENSSEDCPVWGAKFLCKGE